MLTLASVAVFGSHGHAGGGFSFAQGGPRGGHGHGGPEGGPRGGGHLLGPLARDLNLSDAQKTEIKKLTDAFEASTKSLHEQLKATGGPGGEFKEGAFDEAAVRAAAQSRAAVHVELEVAHARLMSQVYALLTAEQKAQLAERRQQFEQRRRDFESRKGDAPGAL